MNNKGLRINRSISIRAFFVWSCAGVPCREDEGFLMLTDISSGLNAKREYMNPKVKGHYSAKGLECLGRAAAETLGNIR